MVPVERENSVYGARVKLVSESVAVPRVDKVFVSATIVNNNHSRDATSAIGMERVQQKRCVRP